MRLLLSLFQQLGEFIIIAIFLVYVCVYIQSTFMCSKLAALKLEVVPFLPSILTRRLPCTKTLIVDDERSLMFTHSNRHVNMKRVYSGTVGSASKSYTHARVGPAASNMNERRIFRRKNDIKSVRFSEKAPNIYYLLLLLLFERFLHGVYTLFFQRVQFI